MRLTAWTVHTPSEPMVRETRDVTPSEHDVIVEVAGCGVCHTDLSFFYDGVPVRHGYPLTLGHEISGVVVETGRIGELWLGQQVIVPAVIPCGKCFACSDQRGSICKKQIFPGNDVHGGFATHVQVPARGLCPVPDLADPMQNPEGLALSSLSVIADAVTTPYQAIVRSGIADGDLAVFVGVGGVGGYGVQIANALGAIVVAIDIDKDRLDRMKKHGADLVLHADELDARAIKTKIRKLADEKEVPTWRRAIFETSGTPSGQTLAFGLLEHGGYMSVIGYTYEKVDVRLSQLMALDATVQGNWGCLPEHYPAVLDMVLSAEVSIEPFIEHRSLDSINETFTALHRHEIKNRVVLTPEH